MKISLRCLALVVLAALPIVGRAQPIYTNSDGSAGTLTLGSATSPGYYTAIQTFTGFTNIAGMTWQLTNTSGSNASANFNAYIVGWTGTTAVTDTLQIYQYQLGGVSTGIVGAGLTAGLTFADSIAPLTASSTYALVLSYVSGDQTFVASLGNNPNAGFFGSGGAGSAFTSSDQAGFQAALEGFGTAFGSAINPTLAYTMSVDTSAPTPVPEPKTAAAGIAVLFVGVLMGRRVWQRNKLAAVPLAA